ncbi:MAG: hypothetical protein ABIF09_10710 [Gemmatimonadota bacterium]
MQNKENLWYHLGYALGKGRRQLPAKRESRAGKPSPVDDVSHKVLDAFLAVGAGSVLTRALALWPSRRGPGLFRLFRAGAAGAAAAFLAELARPVLTGKTTETALEEKLTDILLAGAGRGLLYAALVEPRIPAPPILQGLAYGSLEYALRPWGGLGKLAGSQAPHGKIPALQILLKDRGADEHLVEHVAFGVALALLYDR